jgi:glycosyltransferase involved in cell wall biosynthesis
MRVLLIAYHYPPSDTVGALRSGRIADALRSRGHDVQIVTGRERQHPSSDRSGSGVAHVHRVRTLPNGREIAIRLRSLVRGRSTPPERSDSKPGGAYVPPDHVPSWKRFLVAMALMPDDQQGFILPAFFQCLRLMFRKVDLVYTSGPPHSVHIVGLLLKWVTGVSWTAEFRDPWIDNAVQPRYASSATAHRIKRKLERLCIRSADRIVAVTEAAGRLFAEKASDPSRVLVVRNGLDQLPRAHLQLRDDREFRVAYVGNLYHRRDPGPFLEAISWLREQGALPKCSMRVDFWGQCRYFEGKSIAETAKTLGIGDLVFVNDPIPRDEALRVMEDSDLLLLLACEQPLQVPQKLYEYIAAGPPILAFADAEGETASMLQRIGGHHLVTTHDSAMVRLVVDAALNGRTPPRDPSADALLSDWSADRQLGRLVEALELR